MKTTVLFFLMTATVAFARLGESNAQILARYGAVQERTELETNIWRGTYLFKEYNINVIYFTNTCVAELVQPIESRKFSSDERDSLMKSIGGEGWLKDDSEFELMADSWLNTNTKARARVEQKFMKPSTLFVMAQPFLDWSIAKTQKKEKAKADGF